MQKHLANLRQAGEPAAPQQQFKTPQAEIEHVKRTDRTLAGFARILEIVRDSDFYSIQQRRGHVNGNWLTTHRTDCGSCVGALLAWFYDTPTDDDGDYCFTNGIIALMRRLELDDVQTENAVKQARAAAGDDRDTPPFSGWCWHADYAAVFHELARRYPGK